MKSDLISVIVPVYKVEKYLDECVQSIVNQTHRNLEIILVDDGSPDRCPQLCDEWAEKDSRIRVIHQKNSGLSAARNAGLDVAKGDYIGFVDSDDYIAPDMYEQLLIPLLKENKKTSCCLISRVFDNGTIVAESRDSEYDEVMNVQKAVEASFYNEVCNAVWCKLYDKSVFECIRFPLNEVNEDYPVMIPVIVKSEGLVLVKKPLYYYRKRAGSITSLDYATSKSVHFIYKNLMLIGDQLKHFDIQCKKSYAFFVARNAFSMALIMEKHIEKLDDKAKNILTDYIRLMKKNMVYFMLSERSALKDKVLYMMVLTRTLKPLYSVFNKKI